jgi:hypothetical protein
LLGPAAVEGFAALERRPPQRDPSRLFDRGGYAVMRADWSRHAHQLIFDVGPIGELAHGHADLLSIQCAVAGGPCIVDAGTYCYTADARWREHFRNSAAHNTVTVDDVSQASLAGPFGWRDRPEARLRAWHSSDAADFADGEARFARGAGSIVHRRRVLFVKPRYWVVVDDIGGTGAHTVTLRLQFGPIEVRTERSPWIRARPPGGVDLLIATFAREPIEVAIVEGALDPPEGWVSPDYGRRVAAPLLRCSARAELPLRLLTLLYPIGHGAPAPNVLPQLDKLGAIAGITFEESGEQVVLEPQTGSLKVLERG